MVAGSNVIHDKGISTNTRNRQHATGHTLAHNKKIRLHTLPIDAHHLACATEASLNLVSRHQHVILRTQITNSLNISVVGNNHTALALDRFNEYSANIWVSFQHALKVFQVVVFKQFEASSERAELMIARRVVASARSRDRAAPEISSREQNVGLVVGDALGAVAPTAGQFASCLIGFDAGVHGNQFFVAKELG